MRRRVVGMGLGLLAVVIGAVWAWTELAERRVAVVVEGRIVRGAWQRPWTLRRLIDREHIRTVVTLTAINRDDPKYVAQAEVVRRAGVGWVIVPMRGSRATLEQMAEAADLVADAARQPVFVHCVGGHHRTGLVHAAYRIRHEGWSAERAWRELAALPWTRPDAEPDRNDRRLIEAFAAAQARPASPARSRKEARDEAVPGPEGSAVHRGGAGPAAPAGPPAVGRG